MSDNALLRRVKDEVYHVIAPEYGTEPDRVTFDQQEGLWVCVKQLPVPAKLTHNGDGRVDVLMLIPLVYPQVPPDGFYCDAGLKITHHYFRGMRDKHYPEWQQQLIAAKWNWFCAHAYNVSNSTWRPTSQPDKGDNLMTYLHLCLGILGLEGRKTRMTRPTAVDVIFTDDQFTWLHAHLFQPNGDEQAAFAFATPVEGAGRLKLLVHHLLPMEPADFITQNGGYLHMTDEAAQRIARHTLTHDYSLIEIHSHPFADEHVGFSGIDTGQAMPRFEWFAGKAKPPFHHLMLVFGHDSADGMIYNPDAGTMDAIDGVTILSHPMKRYDIRPADGVQDAEHAARYRARFARQVQAFGEQGQARVKVARVGIVGLGGIGSAVAQQLALLGVRHFILMDGDALEESNLNRFVGGDWHDAARSRKKVDVVRDSLEFIDPQAMHIETYAAHFPTADGAASLKMCDIIFGCTDTHGSRLLLNTFSVQYLLPYIDIGVGINTDADGKIIESGGQYRVVVPDGFCLECVRAINANMAADDLLPPDQRQIRRAHGYIPAEDIHAPSVVFLNSTLASLAVGEFLNLLTGYRAPQRLTYYFLHDQSIRTIHADRRDDCAVCGAGGRLAMGDHESILGLTSAIPSAPANLPVPTHGRPTSA